jgi:hypothetical protein
MLTSADPELAEALNAEALDIAERHGFPLLFAGALQIWPQRHSSGGDSAVALPKPRAAAGPR